ncbi:DNA cytosine methyltransferase [Candidatus Pacearchaeota archaeon]|nr:DNA cytosine methyltransferase [Candidatus Pacearchaeota archaeon]
MDSTKELLGVLSLCTGYGGLELGIERVLGEVRVLAHVEIEAFAIANLVNKMETGRMVPAPIWTDLKTIPLEPFRGKVDILTGGYPCQPFSAVGKRKGENDPRHLWPYIRRIIRGCNPTWCFFENVEGHVTLGLSSVISDLEEMGYTTTWGIFSAEEVGAPHQRKRVFILAHCISKGLEGHAGDGTGCPRQVRKVQEQDRPIGTVSVPSRWPSRPGEEQYEWEEPRVVVDPAEQGLPIGSSGQVGEPQGEKPESERPADGSKRKTKSQLGRSVDGLRARVDRLRLLGNGVVPQTAEKAFRTLLRRFEALYRGIEDGV